MQFEKSYWTGMSHESGLYKYEPMFPKAFKRANKVFWNPLEDTCGDLMFSGHTVALWTSAFVFYEYSKSKMLQFSVFLLAFCGTVVIVGTMFHYTLGKFNTYVVLKYLI